MPPKDQVCAERMYLTAGKDRLVPDGDEEAAFLYASPGDFIPGAACEQFKIEDGKLPAPKKAPAVNKPPAVKKAPASKKAPAAKKAAKSTPPAEDKATPAGENKVAGEGESKTEGGGA
ncbi:MAG: hypothetical protein AAF494_01740 [Pseudomonadota bacterium]